MKTLRLLLFLLCVCAKAQYVNGQHQTSTERCYVSQVTKTVLYGNKWLNDKRTTFWFYNSAGKLVADSEQVLEQTAYPYYETFYYNKDTVVVGGIRIQLNAFGFADKILFEDLSSCIATYDDAGGIQKAVWFEPEILQNNRPETHVTIDSIIYSDGNIIAYRETDSVRYGKTIIRDLPSGNIIPKGDERRSKWNTSKHITTCSYYADKQYLQSCDPIGKMYGICNYFKPARLQPYNKNLIKAVHNITGEIDAAYNTRLDEIYKYEFDNSGRVIRMKIIIKGGPGTEKRIFDYKYTCE